jgi:hypothetical protein
MFTRENGPVMTPDPLKQRLDLVKRAGDSTVGRRRDQASQDLELKSRLKELRCSVEVEAVQDAVPINRFET